MKVSKVIMIEDQTGKGGDINSAVKRYGINNLEWYFDAESGIEEIEVAIQNGEPYDVLILDMQFPVKGCLNEEAGEYVLQQLKKKNIELPIIICSTLRLQMSEVVGCIWYNKNYDLYDDMREMLDKIKAM